MRVDPPTSALPSAQSDASTKRLALHDWEALTLQTRVTCLLFDALTALDVIWLDLQTEEGNALRWIEPHLLAVRGEVEKIMERLAS
ncbi:MAG: hypothetical protein QOC81_253 [Thermoanaerobaculia bacterium]|jgi:hypothetical protein|nr:hypothetical protein [Thermoanaerobaculia bacterium]